jgi:hypothetical protein
VDFNEDTSVFVTFNDSDSDNKKSNQIVDVTLEQINSIKRIINENVLNYITTHMRQELKSLYEFAKLYNHHHETKDYYAFFSQDVDDINTGSIGWPQEGDIDKEMEYLYSNGNIREIMTAIANFLKNSKNVKHRGCKMLWDLYLDTDKYINNNQKIFNINSINARKEELKVLIGYNDLNIIKSRINEIGNETDWCQLAIPFKLTTRYTLTSRQAHHIGKFPSDMRPVRKASTTEISHCIKTHNAVHYPELSVKEAEYIEGRGENKQSPYKPGKCYYKPNTTLTDYKDIHEKYRKSSIMNDELPKTTPFETQMRRTYNHPNIANVSGHALLIFDILALFRPYTDIEEKMNIFDTIKRLAIIALANIIWLVPPQHHSIHEVLQASILTKFHYDKTDIKGDIDGYIRGEYDGTQPIETTIHNLVGTLNLP